jgi:cytochrome b subunit of formate dehydrogenase
MQLMRNAKRKFDFLTFFKFLLACLWRALLLAILSGILTGMGLVHANMYFNDHYGASLYSPSEAKTIISFLGFFFSIIISIFVLKWITAKSYKTFKVVWNSNPPRNIVDKQFLHSAFLFSLSSSSISYLFGFIIGDFHDLLKVISDLLIGAIFLFIFIKNNWFNFQLKKL